MKLPKPYAKISTEIIRFCELTGYHLLSVMSRHALDEMIINYMTHAELDHESLSDRQWKRLHKNLIHDLRIKYGASREKAFMAQLNCLLEEWDAWIKIEDATCRDDSETMYAHSKHFRPCGVYLGTSVEGKS